MTVLRVCQRGKVEGSRQAVCPLKAIIVPAVSAATLVTCNRNSPLSIVYTTQHRETETGPGTPGTLHGIHRSRICNAAYRNFLRGKIAPTLRSYCQAPTVHCARVCGFMGQSSNTSKTANRLGNSMSMSFLHFEQIGGPDVVVSADRPCQGRYSPCPRM